MQTRKSLWGEIYIYIETYCGKIESQASEQNEFSLNRFTRPTRKDHFINSEYRFLHNIATPDSFAI